MTCMLLAVLLLVVGGPVDCAAAEESAPCGKPCREHPQLVGKCFAVRGRMSLWNGNPSIRIWRVGTKRMLGVSEQRFRLESHCNLPPTIAERIQLGTDLLADFAVCPFTEEKPGEMQLVRVDGATHMSVLKSGK